MSLLLYCLRNSVSSTVKFTPSLTNVTITQSEDLNNYLIIDTKGTWYNVWWFALSSNGIGLYANGIRVGYTYWDEH